MCWLLETYILCPYTTIKYWLHTILKWGIFRNVIILYLCTFFVVLPYVLRDLKYSRHFKTPDESEAQLHMKKENDLHLEMAEEYFKKANASEIKKITSKEPHDIVISVISTSRNRIMTKSGYKPRYLTQVTWKLVSLLTKYSLQKDSYNIGFFICNVDHNAKTYEEATKLENFIQMVKRFKGIYFNMDHVLEKEKQDYAFCLNESFVNHPAKYHMLVEDDALPTDNLFEVLNHVIKTHLDSKHKLRDIDKPKKALYVKFYHPERLLGYSSLEPQRLLELFSLALILTSIVISFQNLTFKLDVRTWILWIVVTIYFTILITDIGRVNIIKFKKWFSPHLYSLSPAPSCCTPAILYPNETIDKVIRYLSNSHCRNGYGKDSILDEVVTAENIPAYLVEPNVFQHIGAYSVLRSSVVNSQFV